MRVSDIGRIVCGANLPAVFDKVVSVVRLSLTALQLSKLANQNGEIRPINRCLNTLNFSSISNEAYDPTIIIITSLLEEAGGFTTTATASPSFDLSDLFFWWFLNFCCCNCSTLWERANSIDFNSKPWINGQKDKLENECVNWSYSWSKQRVRDLLWRARIFISTTLNSKDTLRSNIASPTPSFVHSFQNRRKLRSRSKENKSWSKPKSARLWIPNPETSRSSERRGRERPKI